MFPPSTLKMETVCSFKTLITIYQTTRCHKPEDHSINVHCCENLKSCTYLQPIFLMIHFNITVPSTIWSLKWFLALRYYSEKFYAFIFYSACYTYIQLHIFVSYHRQEYKLKKYVTASLIHRTPILQKGCFIENMSISWNSITWNLFIFPLILML
jgi:hypothetical protein